MMRQRTQLFWEGGGGSGGSGGGGGGVSGFVVSRFVDGRSGPNADIAVCGEAVS